MRQYITLIIACFCLLMTCSDSSKKTEAIEPTPTPHKLVQLDMSLDNVSRITIKADSGTSIKGKNGTKLEIEKNAFVDANGAPITSDIELVVKEVTTLSEMLQENISTVTKDGILETKGMMKIEAYADGKPLQLGKNKSIEAYFPVFGQKDEQAKLYYGIKNDQNTIEWELAEEPTKTKVTKSKYGMNTSIRYSILEELDNKRAFFNNQAGGKKLLEEALVFSEAEQAQLLGKSIQVYWILFDDGDLEIYSIKGDISEQLKQKIEKTLNDIPFIKPFIREGSPAQMDGTIDISVYDQQAVDAQKFYNLSLNRLGWINCDVFIKFDVPKIDMSVNASKDAVVKILFKNYQTLVTSYKNQGKSFFTKIPKDEPIKVIVTEYDELNKLAKYSVTESVVQSELKELNPYESLSLEELKIRMEALK